MTDFTYHNHIPGIQEIDLSEIVRKDVSYDASWKKRGGVGAFMMLARKWDRLEAEVSRAGYDVLTLIESEQGPGQGDDGTALAEIRDLRRYLTLLEAEATERGYVERRRWHGFYVPGTPEDGGQHAEPLPSETRREPIEPTWKEFESFENDEIRHGPMKGYVWGDLYGPPAESGRRKMDTAFVENYGK